MGNLIVVQTYHNDRSTTRKKNKNIGGLGFNLDTALKNFVKKKSLETKK